MANRIAILITVVFFIGLLQSYTSAQAIRSQTQAFNRDLSGVIERVERMTDEMGKIGRPLRPDHTSMNRADPQKLEVAYLAVSRSQSIIDKWCRRVAADKSVVNTQLLELKQAEQHLEHAIWVLAKQ